MRNPSQLLAGLAGSVVLVVVILAFAEHSGALIVLGLFPAAVFACGAALLLVRVTPSTEFLLLLASVGVVLLSAWFASLLQNWAYVVYGLWSASLCITTAVVLRARKPPTGAAK